MREEPTFKPSWSLPMVVWLYAALTSLWVGNGWGSQAVNRFIGSWAEAPAEFVVLVMLAPLLRRLAPGYRRRGWGLLFAAVFSDVIANFLWGVVLIPGLQHLQWLSDVMSLSYYGLIAAAFAMFFLELGGSFRSVRVWLDAATMSLGFIATAWLFLASQADTASTLTASLSFPGGFYALGDGAAVIFGALLLIQIVDWRAERAMLLLITAVAIAFLGDLVWFDQRASDGTHVESGICVFAYCTYAALLASAVEAERGRASGIDRARFSPAHAHSLLPVASIILAICMLIVQQSTRHGVRSSVIIGFALIGGALVGARQLSARFEIRRLNRVLAQQEADKRFTELVRRSSDVIAIVNGHRRFSFVSPAAQAVLGMSPAALRFAAAAGVLGPENEGRLASFLEHVIANKLEISEIEVEFRTPSGERKTVQVVASDQLANPSIDGIALTLRDVSNERRLERELREITLRERELLSGDLHEGLGQELTGIALMLRSLKFSPKADCDALESMRDGIIGQVNRSIATARNLASGLSPLRVARGSLDLALSRLAAEAHERYALRVNFHHDLRGRVLSASEADHLYRIAQDCIANALQHGGCSAVDIDLGVEGDHLTLSIGDDCTDGHYDTGLIAYRTRVMGGQMYLDHPQSGGTRIQVIVPLHDDPGANRTKH